MEGSMMLALKMMLLAIGFLGLIIEVKTGGLGAGALLGIIAAGVFFGREYIEGLVPLWHIGLFLGGVLCVAAEILMPTVGLLAGLGVAAMLISIVLSLGGNLDAVYVLSASLAIAALLFVLVAKRLPESRLLKKIVLDESTTSERGYVSAKTRTGLVGLIGTAETKLRPAGRAVFSGEAVDVVSDGDFIDKGAPVLVVSAQGSRVVVREVKD